MTRKQAERLGWIFHEGRKPKLIEDDEGYRVLRGFASAERTYAPAGIPASTRRFDVETFDLDDGWADMQARLLRLVADFEEQHG